MGNLVENVKQVSAPEKGTWTQYMNQKVKTAREENWKAFMMWSSECRDQEEKSKLAGLKHSLEEVQDKLKNARTQTPH